MDIKDRKISENINITPMNFSMYDTHKKRYEKFQEDMKKSDLSQGYTRYLQEFYILETLAKFAIEENRNDEINFVRENTLRVENKLKNSFGITIKSETLEKIK